MLLEWERNQICFSELPDYDREDPTCPEEPNSFLSPSVDSFIWLAPEALVESEQAALAHQYYKKYTNYIAYEEHWVEQNSWFVAENMCTDRDMMLYEAKDALSVWALATIIGNNFLRTISLIKIKLHKKLWNKSKRGRRD